MSITIPQEIRTTALSEAIRSTVTTNGLPNSHLEILKVASDYESFIANGKTPSSKKPRKSGSNATRDTILALRKARGAK